MNKSLFLVLLPALGCSTPVAESRPGGAASSRPETYRITSFEVGRKLEGEVVSQRAFSRTDSVILAVRIQAGKPGQVLRVALIPTGTDRPSQEESAELLPGENTVQRDLWKARLGLNRVEVSVDGEPVATHVFEIRDVDSLEPGDDTASAPDVIPPRLKRPGGPGDPPPDQIAPEGLRGTLVVRCLVTREGTAESCVVLQPVKGANALALSWLTRQRWDAAMLRHIPVDVRYVFNFQFGPKSQ